MKLNPEEKRLLSERRREVRKEKSREAARSRRGKESEVFAELIDALPVPELSKSTLDKTSIMRLSINYMKLRDFFTNIWTKELEHPTQDTAACIKDLFGVSHGFLLILAPTSEIIYVSENIKKNLGLSQYEMIGNTAAEFVHACDMQEVDAMLKSKTESFTLVARLKNTLLAKGRVVNLKSANYKPVKFSGHRLTADMKPDLVKTAGGSQPLTECIVLTGTTLPDPSQLDHPLDSHTFVSSHSLDLKLLDCDSQLTDLTLYPMETIAGASFYSVIHAQDLPAVEQSFKTLLSKGQCETDPYRMLVYGGGYLTIVTQATVVLDPKTGQPQHVVCIHNIIGELEDVGLILADIQMVKNEALLHNVKVKESPRSCRMEVATSNQPPSDIVTLTASLFSSVDDDILATTSNIFDDVDDIEATTANVFGEEVKFGGRSLYSDDFRNGGKRDLEQLVERLEADVSGGLVADSLTNGLDEDFYLRAPYIPMDTDNDVLLLDDYLNESTYATSPLNLLSPTDCSSSLSPVAKGDYFGMNSLQLADMCNTEPDSSTVVFPSASESGTTMMNLSSAVSSSGSTRPYAQQLLLPHERSSDSRICPPHQEDVLNMPRKRKLPHSELQADGLKYEAPSRKSNGHHQEKIGISTELAEQMSASAAVFSSETPSEFNIHDPAWWVQMTANGNLDEPMDKRSYFSSPAGNEQSAGSSGGIPMMSKVPLAGTANLLKSIKTEGGKQNSVIRASADSTSGVRQQSHNILLSLLSEAN